MGMLTKTGYKGSLGYCIQEIKNALVKESIVKVDAYYNEAYALDKSLREVSKIYCQK